MKKIYLVCFVVIAFSISANSLQSQNQMKIQMEPGIQDNQTILNIVPLSE